MREYMLRRYHERLAEARQRLGGRCARCTAVNDLQLDHRDWLEKTLDIARMWAVAKVRFDAELEKCQLLCPPCHIAKSKEDVQEILADRGLRGFHQLSEDAYQHGSPRMKLYRRCGCGPCCEAFRQYRAKQIAIDGTPR
jgi:hypothetical protein